MKHEFFRQIFEKSWNIECHENPPSGSLVGPSVRTDTTELTVAFRNFANAPKSVIKNHTPLNGWGGAAVAAQWLRCCATNRKIAGSIPAGVTGIFH